jgi:hypothetical protein
MDLSQHRMTFAEGDFDGKKGRPQGTILPRRRCFDLDENMANVGSDKLITSAKDRLAAEEQEDRLSTARLRRRRDRARFGRPP